MHPVMKATTVSQLVDELSRFTDAEQWLIIAFVTLWVVMFTCWVGFAVVLVTRTVLGAARFDTRKIRGLAGRADSARAAAGQLRHGTVVLPAD